MAGNIIQNFKRQNTWGEIENDDSVCSFARNRQKWHRVFITSYNELK